MGFWSDLRKKNDESQDDLEMNSRRIETNEDEIDELRDMRDDIPRWDTEARDEIDYKIEKREDRIDYLRSRREDLHEENYCDDEDDD